jgi:hypothetical protein
MNSIDLVLMFGGLLAAFVVCAMCGLGLVVWLAGGDSHLQK